MLKTLTAVGLSLALCGTALAENFRCELPEGAYVSDTTPLQEGDNLLLATYGGLYRVPLTGGDDGIDKGPHAVIDAVAFARVIAAHPRQRLACG